ncbi:unnamed protein product [Protopolystoma xenopodis]|uniref:Uncharacterized protein n=1 Tax=Protopolystoma xenopodis TaxID=117903 RepID=A0A448XGI1_9PLAT|nr:unnamed protein product [Protopolystoma xenopodis]
MISCSIYSIPNGLVAHILTSPGLESFPSDDLQQELITSAITACPDVLSAFLAHIKPSMVPRDSDNWHSTMKLIYNGLSRRIHERLESALELCSGLTQLVSVVADLCLPNKSIHEHLHEALSFDSAVVIEAANKLMSQLETNMILVITWVNTCPKLAGVGPRWTSSEILAELTALITEVGK